MKNALVDTDILVDFLRGREYAKSFLLSLAGEATVCCSTIAVAELHAGMRDHERDKTSELIDGLHVVEVTREIAEKAGSYKRSAKDRHLELCDCLVAATAFAIQATLYTGNAKHYPMADIDRKTVGPRGVA